LREKITCIPHGLDLHHYHPTSGSNKHAGLPVILSVGQLKERKGFADLIQACRILKDRRQPFRLWIVGQGPQKDVLEGLIASLSLEEEVSLLGALPHEEVIRLYTRATIFALPCLQTKEGDVDGIPNVLAEAMAMLVPVISTYVGAIPELVTDESSGLLVPPEHPDSLADAIVRLLNAPSLRERLAANGRRQVIEGFDIERNGQRFAEELWPEWFSELGGRFAEGRI
jgi:glycosyltransferase involved in cell wall biosynthesis